MAFGGVETGKNRAQLALNPMISGRMSGLLTAQRLAAGIKMAAAAVLLIILEAKTVIAANVAIKNPVERERF